MIAILLIASLLFCCSCTAPQRSAPSVALTDAAASSPQRSKVSSDTAPAETTPVVLPELPPPPIPPAQWKGLGFYVLPKQEFVRRLGYELYSCRPENCASVKVDTAWELGTRRIRCDRLSGGFIFVESVERTGNEWLVTFNHPQTGRTLYATTREEAITEIASAADLDGARKRWLGATVFARRGVITAFGTNSTTSFVSIRIDIKDSLSVTDVRWGVTPLPVKPIWLMVTSGGGKSGFIPVRYSWTNTMRRQIGGAVPWEEDIFEQDPEVLYQWDEATWELVNNHRVVLDMTVEQVRISWGNPVSTGTSEIGDRQVETVWNYPSNQLLFSAGRLISIKDLPPTGQ